MTSLAEIPPAAAPSQDPSELRSRITNLFLQTGQRAGAIALLATLAAWAMLYLGKDASVALAITAGLAEIGVATAVLARLVSAPGAPNRREASGIAAFNLVLLVLALQLMLFTRLQVIHSAATQFFTPPPSASSSPPMQTPQ